MKTKKSKKPTPGGPSYDDYLNQEKAAAGRLKNVEKLESIKPKRVNNDEGMKAMLSAPKGPQRSKTTIPVPGKKKMRAKKQARLENKEQRVAKSAEKAFFAGKERKARRKLKKSLKVGNKLRGTSYEPAMSDKDFRKSMRKPRK